MKLHPMNRHFAWQRHSGPFRVVSDEQAQRYDADGYFLLRDAFGTETMSRAIAEIDPFEARTTEFLRSESSGQDRRDRGAVAAEELTSKNEKLFTTEARRH